VARPETSKQVRLAQREFQDRAAPTAEGQGEVLRDVEDEAF
jgi:hypothetical protein